LDPDVDQQTPQSADALLCRTSPQLARLASSDQDDDLDFEAAADDHDNDDSTHRQYYTEISASCENENCSDIAI